jgi:hypothetical protein
VFGAFDSMLERPSSIGTRLFPVAEFLAHVGEVPGVVEALRRAGQLDDVRASCLGYAARTIQRRLERSAGVASGIRHPLLARMLAGALMETIGWWQDHPSAATPAEMDAAFHELARGVLRVAPR